MIHRKKKIAAIMTSLVALHIGHGFAAPAPTTPPTAPAAVPATVKPTSLETQFLNLNKQSKIQTTRLDELEIANRNALTRNQTLQLENDNLSVQVKVLQSDRGAQMFIYGAVAILVGALIGYLIASNFLRRTRRW